MVQVSSTSDVMALDPPGPRHITQITAADDPAARGHSRMRPGSPPRGLCRTWRSRLFRRRSGFPGGRAFWCFGSGRGRPDRGDNRQQYVVSTTYYVASTPCSPTNVYRWAIAFVVVGRTHTTRGVSKFSWVGVLLGSALVVAACGATNPAELDPPLETWPEQRGLVYDWIGGASRFSGV